MSKLEHDPGKSGMCPHSPGVLGGERGRGAAGSIRREPGTYMRKAGSAESAQHHFLPAPAVGDQLGLAATPSIQE